MEKDHEEAHGIAEESISFRKRADQITALKASKSQLVGGFAKNLVQGGGSSQRLTALKLPMPGSCSGDAKVTYAEGFPADKDLYDENTRSTSGCKKLLMRLQSSAGLPDSFESEGYDRSHMRLGWGLPEPSYC